VRPLIAINAMPLEIAAGATLVLDGLVISGEALHPAAADNAKRTLICATAPWCGSHASPRRPGAIPRRASSSNTRLRKSF
jgi:hypothetical protein